MSIEAMKQALQALDLIDKDIEWHDKSPTRKFCNQAAHFLRQAIEQAEKQEPVAVKHMMDWVYQLKRLSNDGRYMNIPSGLSAGACYELAVEIEQFIKTAPVHASDISQECADETAKREHEFEEMVKKGTKAWADTPDDWVDELRGGVEAEKQEAVAWMWKDGTLTSDPDVADGTWTPLFTAPVHARPVVHAVRCTYPQCQATNGCVGACSKGQPDLARVGEVGVWGDKREWVGLTEGEVHDAFNFVEFIKQISFDRDRPEWCENFAAYIEAKLKEKNS